jgi:hypothetical protein
MVKTGRDLAVFGGLLALFIGFLFITAVPNLIKYGDFKAPRSSAVTEQAEVNTGSPKSRETSWGEKEYAGMLSAVAVAAGTICAVGGLTGFAGSALAVRSPRTAGRMMVAAGALAAFTIIGAAATAVLAMAGMREFDFANAPPGTEPEWQDAESLPY